MFDQICDPYQSLEAATNKRILNVLNKSFYQKELHIQAPQITSKERKNNHVRRTFSCCNFFTEVNNGCHIELFLIVKKH